MGSKIHHMLSKVAPGSVLRDAIDDIIRAKTGALIVIGGEPGIDVDCHGGFQLDIPLTAHRIYELAKMDGAIILDRFSKKIRRANVELTPQGEIFPMETGMRHRAAERIARSHDVFAIAISEQKSTVSLYLGDQRYVLHDLGYILTKASGSLASLSRFDRLYRSAMRRLLEHQSKNMQVYLEDVVEVLRRGAIVIQIRDDIEGYIAELGKDGHLISLELEEYVEVGDEWKWLWLDTQREKNGPMASPFSRDMTDWDYETWAVALGYAADVPKNFPIAMRGIHLLHTRTRVPDAIIENIVEKYATLAKLSQSSPEDLDRVDGVGRQRAQVIWRLFHESEE